MNIIELSEKDNYWREKANYICNDRMLADDIVQEMYIYFINVFDKEPNKKLTPWYVVKKMHNMFLDICRTKNKPVPLTSLFYLKDQTKTFEPTDEEYEILLKAEELKWVQKELLKESYDRSYREIETEYPLINYGYAFREVKKARKEILKQ